MSRWKPLPAELHPQVHLLVVRLRRLKDHSELSTRQLVGRTGYSARSWQRYLNGRTLPPREAVEAMARIGAADTDRLLALHEIAAERWAEGRGAATDATEDGPAAARDKPTRPQVSGRRTRALVTATAVALLLSVSASLLLAVRLAETRAQLARARTDTAAGAPVTVSESLVPVVYTCRLEQRDGRWYAGLSRTSDSILAYTYVGPEVAEAQCLLRRAGIPAGDIDGVFGPNTQRAVVRFQTRDDLVVDGVIGPHTWKALREAAPQ